MTQHENRLLQLDAAFQQELKALNELQQYQRQRLYEKYRLRLDEAALRVGNERGWREVLHDD